MEDIVLDSPVDREVVVGGKRYVYFGGNNYLGLANHGAVLGAARQSLLAHGLSAAASRETSGTSRAHVELEEALAAFCRKPAAAIFSSGYLAVAAMVAALRARADVLLVDERTHVSGRDAATLAGLDIVLFAHLSPDALARAAAALGSRRALVLTDGLFPQDGAIAPLDRYLEALGAREAILLVDDAHGLGVLGASGRGTAEHRGVEDDPRVFTVATLSKALGSFGGCAPCDPALRERIRATAAYAGATPIPPPAAAGAAAAVRLLAGDPSILARLRDNVARVKAGLREAGIEAPDSPAPIVQIAWPEREKLERAHARLRERGLLVPLVRYPGGPPQGALRLTISAAHTADDAGRLVAAWRSLA